ncbi:glycosyltransferase [Capnocytophaga ochracea]|uniref:Glycosyltransferase n=1 Tax=Capnocytophaga ochracea TaxID=1018 RepID=A0AA46ZYB5_CAPOC|nr:glycosyltransferase [Capnocytophaga ochracea]
MTHRSFQKISEKNGREVRGILVKNGCKEGEGSL